MDTDLILEVYSLSKNFGTVKALVDISFQLERGKILGIVGDNGAGKSTLVKILSGAIPLTSGKIYLEGLKVSFKSTADAMRMGIATVYEFQTPQLVDIAKVWQNFFMGREEKKGKGLISLLDVKKMKHQTVTAMAKRGHELDVEREVRELSGGQRGILFITRALESSPMILLLDEPTTGLSKRVINEIFNLLHKAAEEKRFTIIITSQWFESIKSLVDEVIVMRRGEIVGHYDVKNANNVEIFKLAMGLTNPIKSNQT